jgi:hypothetical protein
MICGDRGRYGNAENLLSPCARFLLSGDEATRILAEMEAMVKQRWYEVARREGVSEQDFERIGTSFAYEGFRLALEAAALCGIWGTGKAACGSFAGLGRAQLCFVVPIATGALWQVIEITPDFFGPPLS